MNRLTYRFGADLVQILALQVHRKMAPRWSKCYQSKGMPARFSEHTGFIGYDDEFKAEEVRLTLRKLQKDYLIDMEDAVVAVKNGEGK